MSILPAGNKKDARVAASREVLAAIEAGQLEVPARSQVTPVTQSTGAESTATTVVKMEVVTTSANVSGF